MKKKNHIYYFRRTDEPKSGARVCSCHFRGRNKLNGPTILPHRLNQFDIHHLTSENKKTCKNSPKLIMIKETEKDIVSEFVYNTTLDLDNEPTKSISLGYHSFFERYDLI